MLFENIIQLSVQVDNLLINFSREEFNFGIVVELICRLHDLYRVLVGAASC